MNPTYELGIPILTATGIALVEWWICHRLMYAPEDAFDLRFYREI